MYTLPELIRIEICMPCSITNESLLFRRQCTELLLQTFTLISDPTIILILSLSALPQGDLDPAEVFHPGWHVRPATAFK